MVDLKWFFIPWPIPLTGLIVVTLVRQLRTNVPCYEVKTSLDIPVSPNLSLHKYPTFCFHYHFITSPGSRSEHQRGKNNFIDKLLLRVYVLISFCA
jgi:hypothetical protein